MSATFRHRCLMIVVLALLIVNTGLVIKLNQVGGCFAAVNYAAGAMLAEGADHTVAWWGVQDACK